MSGANGGSVSGFEVAIVPIDSIRPDPANVRLHGERSVEAIKGSLRRFGFQKPLVVDRDGIVRAGNASLLAARKLGLKTVPIRRSGLSGVEATAFAVADNRTAELAEWDEEVLSKQLDELLESGLSLDVDLGFTHDDLLKIGSRLGNDASDEDAQPQFELGEQLQREWGTGRGQVWEVSGNVAHRLMCGDSMSKDDVHRLMAGERASLCFTSPPYAQQREYRPECNVPAWDVLMRGVFGHLPMDEEAQVLVNLGLVHRDGEWCPYWDGWIEWMRAQGWKRFGWYVWDQGPGMPGNWGGRLAPSHEFVFHFCRRSRQPTKARACIHAGQRHGGKGQRGKDGQVKPRSSGTSPVQETAINDSVCRVNRQGASHGAKGHPAPFPRALPIHFMESWHGMIYEPFSGAGTSLLAADSLSRESRAMEISPAYVAVALQRFKEAGLQCSRKE